MQGKTGKNAEPSCPLGMIEISDPAVNAAVATQIDFQQPAREPANNSIAP